MKRLNEIFHVTYGNKFDLNKMDHLKTSNGGVNFVGRSSKNHGVSDTVAPLPEIIPYEAGLITVALGGTKLLSSFIQEKPFYTAQNVAVLRPKKPMTFAEKLFICLCIRHNRFRYCAFGREANRTLRDLLVPASKEFPDWVRNQKPGAIDAISHPAITTNLHPVNCSEWAWFELQSLFEIKKGKRLTKANQSPGETPYIGAIAQNNGVSSYIGQKAIHAGGTITVSYNGSVAEAFYQPCPFWATDDVNVLYPRFKLTPAIALFITTLIRLEKYRFNFGRKWHMERMRESCICLPIKADKTPDWNFMENYIKSLPYSSQI